MLLLPTALLDPTSPAKPHCLSRQHRRARAAIRNMPEQAFIGEPNYMADLRSLSRQKNDLFKRKTDLSPWRNGVQAASPWRSICNSQILLRLNSIRRRVNGFTILMTLCIPGAFGRDFTEDIQLRVALHLSPRARLTLEILREPKMALIPVQLSSCRHGPPGRARYTFLWEFLTILCKLPFEFSSSPWLFSHSARWLRHSLLPPRPQAAMPTCNWWLCSAAMACARPLGHAIYMAIRRCAVARVGCAAGLSYCARLSTNEALRSVGPQQIREREPVRRRGLRRCRSRLDHRGQRPAHARNGQSSRGGHVSRLHHRGARAA